MRRGDVHPAPDSSFGDWFRVFSELLRRGDAVLLRNGRSKRTIKPRDQVGEPFLDVGLGDQLGSKQRAITDFDPIFLDPEQTVNPAKGIQESRVSPFPSEENHGWCGTPAICV